MDGLSKAQPHEEAVLKLFRTMSLIRQFEISSAGLLASGALHGTLHMSIGQEAVAAGVCDVLTSDDYITSTHRGHGHCIAKGGKLKPMMSELYGRAGGYSAGRSGSMHLADAEIGILGANAIVGAGIPIAVGAGFSAKARGSRQVSVTFFGEGAVAEGVFHESLNLAALWKLPVIFICENNGYAEMSPMSIHLATKNVIDFASPYGITGVQVDGNDVFAVRTAAAEAVERARGGDGPTLIECITYRVHGHYEGDPQRYRDKAEVEHWKTKDPLKMLLDLVSNNDSLVSQMEEITVQVLSEVQEAIAWAEADLLPETSSVTSDVYRDPSSFIQNWSTWRSRMTQSGTL
jgi:TPP-dependent pyruvate/acetoin dehydrogenase alpha subunit